MEKLGVSQAKLIANQQLKANKEQLEEAVLHDERAQLHSMSVNKKSDLKAYDRFLNEFVGKIIEPAKLQVFDHLQSIPFDTAEILEEFYREITKIFNAQDRFIKHKFKTEDNEKDFNDYLKKIGDGKFLKTDGMEIFKNFINSFVVVDYPGFDYYINKGEEIPERPEPYYYTVHASEVLSVKICDSNDDKIDWIAFRDPMNDRKINIFDDVNLFIFEKDDNSDMKLIYEAEHGFSQCPVTSFWHTPFNLKNRVQKRGLISNNFGQLDWIQTMITMSKHAELYSGFPITSSYEEDCDYTDGHGNNCENGVIRRTFKDGHNSSDYREVVEDCPACSSNKNLGAGSHKIAPARADKEDPDLIDAVKFIQIPVEQLKRLEEATQNKINNLEKNLIGVLLDPSGQAKNEDQIRAGHESRQAILEEVKANFETTHRFYIERMAEVRYGEDYEGSIINYGNNFFLYSSGQLIDAYSQAKKDGLPDYILDDMRQSINEVKFQNNPLAKDRFNILAKLEPYKNKSVADLKTIKEIDPTSIDPKLFILKSNFSYFIDKFEREYLPVQMVLPFQSMELRINFINSKLMNYVNEQLTEAKEASSGSDPKQKTEPIDS